MENELQHHGVKGMKWGVRKWDRAKGRFNSTKIKTDKDDYGYTLNSINTGNKTNSNGSNGKYKIDTDGPLSSGKLKTDGIRKQPKQYKHDAYENMSTKEIKADNERHKAVEQFKKNHPDPDKVKTQKQIEGMEGLADGFQSASNAARNTSNLVNSIPTKRAKMDLSNMSDAELRNEINRAYMERQYNDLFAKPSRMETGKKVAAGIIGAVGTGLSIAGSALAIAVSIKKLKG